MKFDKKLIFASIVVIVFTIAVFLIKNNRYAICETPNNTLVTNDEIKGKSDQQIDELLAERWLDQYKSSLVCPRDRLDDYRIEKVTSDPIEFTMEYSVSPKYRQSSSWNAGNGVWEGAFIAHKYAFVNIKHTDDGLGIESVGTGP